MYICSAVKSYKWNTVTNSTVRSEMGVLFKNTLLKTIVYRHINYSTNYFLYTHGT